MTGSASSQSGKPGRTECFIASLRLPAGINAATREIPRRSDAAKATSSNGISEDRFGRERERPLFEGKQTQTAVASEVKNASGA
jgi:hypothetical protein